MPVFLPFGVGSCSSFCRNPVVLKFTGNFSPLLAGGFGFVGAVSFLQANSEMDSTATARSNFLIDIIFKC